MMSYNEVLENAKKGLDEIEALMAYDSDGNPVGPAIDSIAAGEARYNRSRAKILNLFTEKSEREVFRALQWEKFGDNVEDEDDELMDEEYFKQLEEDYF